MAARGVIGGSAALALAAWTLSTETGALRHRAVAGPLDTLEALATGLGSGELALDLAATSLRVLAGVALGLVAGLPLGAWAGTSRRVEPGLDFLRAVPPLLVFPLLLLVLGYGEGARIVLVAWASALVVSMHLASGLRARSPARLRALRAMGASRWQTLRWLHAYEALPACATALRHGIATGLVVAVVSEMVVGAPHGLGARALAAQIAYEAPQLYAVILLTGGCGYASGRALLALERRLTSWSAGEIP